MLKVQRSVNGQVVYTLSGQMDAESIVELETLVKSEADGRRRVLNLKDVTLVDQDAVNLLDRYEMEDITLKNCPAYIREWITRQRR
jgi:anti-anti-sigma regulatory factor